MHRAQKAFDIFDTAKNFKRGLPLSFGYGVGYGLFCGGDSAFVAKRIPRSIAGCRNSVRNPVKQVEQTANFKVLGAITAMRQGDSFAGRIHLRLYAKAQPLYGGTVRLRYSRMERNKQRNKQNNNLRRQQKFARYHFAPRHFVRSDFII